MEKANPVPSQIAHRIPTLQFYSGCQNNVPIGMALVASATWIAERIYDSYYRLVEKINPDLSPCGFTDLF